MRTFQGSVSAQNLAASALAHFGSGRMDGASVRAWLEHQGIRQRIEHALSRVLADAWTEGWLVGDRSADALAAGLLLTRRKAASGEDFGVRVDWDDWTPGDVKTARALLEGSGRYAGLAQLLESGDLVIRGISGTMIDRLSTTLAQAAEEGWSRGRTAKALSGLVSDTTRARRIAGTELARATSAASMERYRGLGVEGKEWMEAMDTRVCPRCAENAGEGAIPLNAYFSDGSDMPPGHPDCRCAVGPAFLTAQDLAGQGLDLPGVQTAAEALAGDLGEVEGADVLASSDLEGEGAGELAEAEVPEEEGPDLSDIDTWIDQAKEILDSVEAGFETGPDLGGSMGQVNRIETNDGQTLVRKVVKGIGPDASDSAEQFRDAEVLGAQVARVFGFDSPAVAVRGEFELFMQFVEGTEPPNAWEERPLLMRAMDLVMGNNDRNAENWVLRPDGSPGVFDHGMAFQPWSEPGTVPIWNETTLDGLAHDGKWITNDLDPGQLKEIRKGLLGLENEFESLGRGEWLDDALERLDILIDHAGRTAATDAGELTGPDALMSAPVSINPTQARGELTELERLALQDYRGAQFIRVNKALRADEGDLSGLDLHATRFDVQLKPMINNIDSAMGKSGLDNDVVVWRGARDGDSIFGDAWNSLMTGAEWNEYGYVSTTSDAGWAERFANVNIGENRFTVELHVPKGTGAIQLSGNSYESELLLKRGLRLRVTGDSGPGTSPRRIIAEVIHA